MLKVWIASSRSYAAAGGDGGVPDRDAQTPAQKHVSGRTGPPQSINMHKLTCLDRDRKEESNGYANVGLMRRGDGDIGD